MRHQLNVPLYESSGVLVGLGLNRGGRDFSDAELGVMELLRVELRRIVAAREGPRRRRSSKPASPAGRPRCSCWVRTTNREIAETLGISRRTVEKHLEHAYEKLGASSRREALARVRSRAADRRIRISTY